MTTIRAFIKTRPLLSYFALAFAISWGGILMVVGGPGGFPATKEQFESDFLFVMLAWLAGPSVAGILMTGLVHGRAGFRDLLSRMMRWRAGARWYAVALLTAPLLYLVVLLALSPSSPEYLPSIFASEDKATLLLFGIAWGLIGGGFLEELGWTGFAIPTLLRRMRWYPQYWAHRGAAVGSVPLQRDLLGGHPLRSGPASPLAARAALRLAASL